jgi:lipopolysaccharide assembly LptE-like protein
MPKTIKVIAVPAFANNSTNHRLPVLLTADVTRELISRTHYTVIADPTQADAMLTAAVARFDVFPIISDPTTGRTTVVQVAVLMQYTLTDRQTGKAILTRNGAEFRQQYEIAGNPQQYFDEEGTAIERVSRDVARSVVSAILENF